MVTSYLCLKVKESSLVPKSSSLGPGLLVAPVSELKDLPLILINKVGKDRQGRECKTFMTDDDMISLNLFTDNLLFISQATFKFKGCFLLNCHAQI